MRSIRVLIVLPGSGSLRELPAPRFSSNTMMAGTSMMSPRPLLNMLALGLLALNVFSVASAQGGESELDSSPPQRITEQEIIQRFAAKEKEFKIARENYAYRQPLTGQQHTGDA